MGRHPVTYTATSPYNPELAAINNQYFNLFESEPYNPFVDGSLRELVDRAKRQRLAQRPIPQLHLRVGSYFGTQGNSYNISNNSQFRVSAAGSADIGDHALQMGFEYEQRRDAFFSLGPVGLWTLALDHQLAHQGNRRDGQLGDQRGHGLLRDVRSLDRRQPI